MSTRVGPRRNFERMYSERTISGHLPNLDSSPLPLSTSFIAPPVFFMDSISLSLGVFFPFVPLDELTSPTTLCVRFIFVLLHSFVRSLESSQHVLSTTHRFTLGV